MKIFKAAALIVIIATASHAGVMIEEIKDLPNQFGQQEAASEAVSRDPENDLHGFIQFLVMAFLALV